MVVSRSFFLPQFPFSPRDFSAHPRIWCAIGPLLLLSLLTWAIVHHAVIMPNELYIYDAVHWVQDSPVYHPSMMVFQHFNLHDERVHGLQNHSMRQHREYAELWGYKYVASIADIIPLDWTVRQRQMNKIYALMEVIVGELEDKENGAEWLMIADADTLVINPFVPIHAMLPSDRLHPATPPLILGTEDWNGFNSGIMIYRIHLDTIAFLSHALAISDDISRKYEEAAAIGSTEGMESPPSDQRAVCMALEQEPWFSARFYPYPQSWLNGYDLPPTDLSMTLHIHLVADGKYQHDLSRYLEAYSASWRMYDVEEKQNLEVVISNTKGWAADWWAVAVPGCPKCTWI